MNKIAYFTFFFYIIYNFNGYSQSYKSGKITYTVTNKTIDISNIANNDNNVSKELKEKLLKLTNQSSILNYILSFSDKESSFTKEKKMGQKKSFAEILSGKGTHYTSLKERKILHKKEAFGEDFIVDTPFKDWELSQESKLIGKYKCYKATTTKKVESKRGISIKKVSAWYTPEIPVNFGPKEYSGLPGLILELQEGTLSFTATKIELNSEREIKIKKPIKGKKVTLEEYNKIIKDLVTNYRRR